MKLPVAAFGAYAVGLSQKELVSSAKHRQYPANLCARPMVAAALDLRRLKVGPVARLPNLFMGEILGKPGGSFRRNWFI